MKSVFKSGIFSHLGFDFASLLLVLTLVTGVLWSLNRFYFAPRRNGAKANWLLDFGHQFFPVIAAVFILRSFIAEPFRIPSGSMIPTLHVGDFILVNRFAYGLRCPVGDCTIVELGQPKHGDVVVFRYPVDPRLDFIKRVVGLPGDVIRYTNKQLTINGKVQNLEPENSTDMGNILVFSESLDGVIHKTQQYTDRPQQDFEFTVPAGQYFMMGDNRDGSSDSRYWGTVPAEYLKGKAFLVWMSWDNEASGFNKIAFSRIGTKIQ